MAKDKKSFWVWGWNLRNASELTTFRKTEVGGEPEFEVKTLGGALGWGGESGISGMPEEGLLARPAPGDNSNTGQMGWHISVTVHVLLILGRTEERETIWR